MSGSTEEKSRDELATRKDFIRTVGRRKSAVAKVRLFKKGKGNIAINSMSVKDYFPFFEWSDTVMAPLKESALESKVDISVKVLGGGKNGQAVAVRHGIARAIVALDEDYRKSMRAKGFLTRDSRVKERKKPGLKRARRAPQWAKR